nr:diaminopimelate decarboxylase [Clostridia bacterium]
MLHDIYGVNASGHLTIGGADTIELAKEFGTPAYIMDENKIRSMCRIYKDALARYGNGLPLYAGKALCVKGIYRIIAEEGLGADVVSGGELHTIMAAGFPLERAYFHGNNKTDADIKDAIDAGIGCFIADNREELDAIEYYAALAGRKQKILLRITPGIDPHTHQKIITGNVDSKFGSAIETGQALQIVKYALSLPHIELEGLHCHVGSQIFEADPFTDAADIMVRFIALVKAETGWEAQTLNLGGGLGVRYIEEHPHIDYGAEIDRITSTVKSACAANSVKEPKLLLEPGRAIVAAAGITLYTVGSIKQITGFKNYVSVDGGMPDNPRYALYSSPYTVLVANRANQTPYFECSIAGRCCESGDLIQEDVKLAYCERGDILAVLVTGAYNHSMASNYNRLPRPPIIMIKDGNPYTLVRRESYDDLLRNEL